jgi:hypothetical protein
MYHIAWQRLHGLYLHTCSQVIAYIPALDTMYIPIDSHTNDVINSTLCR